MGRKENVILQGTVFNVSHLWKGKSSSKVPWDWICWFPGGYSCLYQKRYFWVFAVGTDWFHCKTQMLHGMEIFTQPFPLVHVAIFHQMG